MKREIFTSAFRRLRSSLLPGGTHILQDAAEADDNLQDVFCRLWARRDSLPTQADVEKMGRVAFRNACVDSLRNRRADMSADSLQIESVEVSSTPDELFEVVDRIIDSVLSERDKQILTLREAYEWEYEDLAAHFSLSEANIRMIVSRARRTVRDVWQKRHTNHEQ